MLDDLYAMSQIFKICFSFIIRNIFWGVGALFKEIRELFRKKIISLDIKTKNNADVILEQSLKPEKAFAFNVKFYHYQLLGRIKLENRECLNRRIPLWPLSAPSGTGSCATGHSKTFQRGLFFNLADILINRNQDKCSFITTLSDKY